MGRPPSGLDDYLDWQQRLESQKESGLSVDVYCLQEGVSRSTFFRWVDRLREGIPESMVAEEAAREQAESGEALFLPVSLKASPVEIGLPNGGCCTAAPRRRPGCAGGSHSSCRCVTSLEGAEFMTDFSDVRIFLCTTPTSMSYSFDSLMGQAQKIFDQDPLSGHLFLFLNRDRDRIKILFWDRDGFCIWYKRLEAGTFQLPMATSNEQGIELDYSQLSKLLGGIDLRSGRRRRRYRRVS